MILQRGITELDCVDDQHKKNVYSQGVVDDATAPYNQVYCFSIVGLMPTRWRQFIDIVINHGVFDSLGGIVP